MRFSYQFTPYGIAPNPDQAQHAPAAVQHAPARLRLVSPAKKPPSLIAQARKILQKTAEHYGIQPQRGTAALCHSTRLA